MANLRGGSLIGGRPIASINDIHIHNNKAVIDGFSKDSAGQLLWNGGVVGDVQKDGTLQTNLNADMLDGKHYTDLQNEFINAAGDNMTGNLSFNTTDGTGITWDRNTDGASIKFFNTGDGDTNSRLEFNIKDNGNEFFRWTAGSTAGTELMKLVPNGTFTAFGHKVWHAGNDGSGSGLDADLLDGLNSSQFLRSDIEQTMSGNLTVNGKIVAGSVGFKAGEGLEIINGSPDYFGTNLDARIVRLIDTNGTSGNVDGGLVFQGYTPTDGVAKELLTLRTNGEMKLLGNQVWHTGNDGKGSGLDADLLDGYNTSDFRSQIKFLAGETIKTVSHNFGSTNFSVALGASSVARHVAWENKTTTTVDIIIDSAYNKEIDVDIILMPY